MPPSLELTSPKKCIGVLVVTVISIHLGFYRQEAVATYNYLVWWRGRDYHSHLQEKIKNRQAGWLTRTGPGGSIRKKECYTVLRCRMEVTWVCTRTQRLVPAHVCCATFSLLKGYTPNGREQCRNAERVKKITVWRICSTVVRTLCFQRRGHGFDLWLRSYESTGHTAQPN